MDKKWRQLEQHWYQDYSRATFIDLGLSESETYRQYTQSCADYLDWKYDEVTGDKALLQKLVDGIWDDTIFLVVEPGAQIAPDVNNSGIIKAVTQ